MELTRADSPDRVLVLNAAEGLLQFVVARRDTNTGRLAGLCAQSWHAPSQGAELLAPALRDALARLHLTASAIQGIASVRGPGSFTGLRLALATAAGLARATGALQAGLDYMALLAENTLALSRPFLPEDSHIWVLTHARRQLVHMQGFTVQDKLVPLGEILVLSPLEAADILAAEQADDKRPPKVVLLGSGLSRNKLALRETLPEQTFPDSVFLPENFNNPHFSTLLTAAEKADFSHRDIAPEYVRPSDAEENLDTIAASLGLDPKTARQKLNSIRSS